MKRIIYAFLIWGLLMLAPTWVNARIPNQHQQFIKGLLADASNTNKTILQQRQHLLALASQRKHGTALTRSDKAWVSQLATHYKVAHINLQQSSSWSRLIKRVDIIPPSLLVAQAVNESGWGTSHVAKTAHNYFGQTCYSPRCGARSHRARRAPAMKAFSSQKESVASYINNLNTNQAYAPLWEIRWQQRTSNQFVSGLTLAEGLTRYSERGHAYISTIKSIIKSYHLSEFDSSLDLSV